MQKTAICIFVAVIITNFTNPFLLFSQYHLTLSMEQSFFLGSLQTLICLISSPHCRAHYPSLLDRTLTRWTRFKPVHSVSLTCIVIFYLLLRLPSEFFPSYFSINILRAFLISSICCAADLTWFKPTCFMWELWRAKIHWDRFLSENFEICSC
jgi:hypothetical protein